ncbi:MAG: sterol carrier family protein [Acidipropionibacterium sp.]|nr:sterol carrier family protein [Acidipropionibacterium sp.]
MAIPRAGLIAASRGLAGVLGERHGGRTIEMRVPPATAVQLEAFGQGPNHHRGTPPNVAETDPATFVQLATGLATWDRGAR